MNLEEVQVDESKEKKQRRKEKACLVDLDVNKVDKLVAEEVVAVEVVEVEIDSKVK